MKLNDLKKAATKAQQDLQVSEQRAAELLRGFKAAKAKTEQARLDYRRLRKAGKLAKKLALEAEEKMCGQRRVWEKAQKRLAKAEKKLAKAQKGKSTKAARPAPRPQPAKTSPPATNVQPSPSTSDEKAAPVAPASQSAPAIVESSPASPAN
jgi:hypothetical protein